ncbi:3'-5' exonuclease family protein [Reticulomyxa filosa]|uniref:3'-5' exonuclease family protein n=1 Tax=Reticulomyxa filosa TaxID=46433 RepID=X6P0J6_RETFI|nr:3'-5' exonuclease family protein [Reticulomyxa filosa]|eukprot:ETO31052.1 3'-5' exonuclease family protein [Reticulomyxa filosa]
MYGLDAEMVSMNLKLPNKPLDCQILQICTADVSCIFDLQVMFVNQSLQNEFDKLLCYIFCESTAIKIGLKKYKCQNSLAFQSPIVPYLDLALCLKYLRESDSIHKLFFFFFFFIFKKKKKNFLYLFSVLTIKKKEGGLAKLVRWILQKQLDKNEQLSNWSLRPLRVTQLKYAALDVLCECWIYQQLFPKLTVFWMSCIAGTTKNLMHFFSHPNTLLLFFLLPVFFLATTKNLPPFQYFFACVGPFFSINSNHLVRFLHHKHSYNQKINSSFVSFVISKPITHTYDLLSKICCLLPLETTQALLLQFELFNKKRLW